MRSEKLGCALVCGAYLLVAASAGGGEYYGDCVGVPLMNKGWNLPADGLNHSVLANTVTVETASDVVLTASVTIERTSSPGTRVVYVWEVDGVQRPPWMMRRVPQQLPNAQTLQTVLPGVAAGDHVFRLLAMHLDTPAQLVRYSVNIMTPQFIDDTGNETALVDSDPLEVVNFGGSWTTLKSLSLPIAVDRMIEIGTSFRIISGSVGTRLEYRFLIGGDEVFAWSEDTPSVMPDGVHLHRFVQGAKSGTQLVEIQARNVAGNTTVARNRFLFAQTMPEYHVYESDTCNAPDWPADSGYHTLLASPFAIIPPISRGDQVGNGFLSFTGGGAFVGIPAQANRTHSFRLQMVAEGSPPFTFDIGERAGRSAATASTFESVLSGGCGGCAWDGSTRHRVELWAKSACNSPGSTMAFGDGSLQVAMVPSRWFFSSSGCTGWVGCCQAAPNCTYICESASLSLVDIGPLPCP